LRITLGNQFVEHGMRPYLYKKYGIDEAAILIRIREQWLGLFRKE